MGPPLSSFRKTFGTLSEYQEKIITGPGINTKNIPFEAAQHIANNAIMSQFSDMDRGISPLFQPSPNVRPPCL
jgi:hypothetical protein